MFLPVAVIQKRHDVGWQVDDGAKNNYFSLILLWVPAVFKL